MIAMEAFLTTIHLHQAQQTDLLQRLVAAQTSSSTQLADNKKGEKKPLLRGRKKAQLSYPVKGNQEVRGSKKCSMFK